MLLAATMLPLTGTSYAEATSKVLLIGQNGLTPIEVEVPKRLIAPKLIVFRPYRDLMLHLSLFLPTHADNVTSAADFLPSNIKGEDEQRASMGGAVSPEDWIGMGRQYGVLVDLDVRTDDLADRITRIFTQVGLDDSGRFKIFVSTYNRSDNKVFYSPVGSPYVWIDCPKQPDAIEYCHMEFMHAKTVSVYMFFPRSYLPKWQALKALVDNIVVVGSST